MTYLVPKPPFFNVKDYGAKGDGTDATAAFQAAIDAALASGRRATLVIPAPNAGSYYAISDTLYIDPGGSGAATTGQCWLNIRAEGGYSHLLWLGGNNKVIFKVLGLCDSIIQGINITCNGQNNVVGWDLDTATNIENVNQLHFLNCHISYPSATGCVGFRLGHVSAGVANISLIEFNQCSVRGDAASAAAANTAGHLGWVNEDPNGLHYTYVNCWGQSLKKVFTTRSVTLAGGGATGTAPTYADGGDAHQYYGCGGGNNYIAYEFTTRGSYHIHGGRWEHGDMLINAGGAGSTNPYSITMVGVRSDGIIPTSRVIACGTNLGVGAFQLVMIGNFILPATSVLSSANFIDLETNSPGVSSLFLAGNSFRSSDPVYAVAGTGQFNIDIRPTNVKLDSSNAVTGTFQTISPMISAAGGLKRVLSDTAAPTAGTWAVGEIVWNSAPAAGGVPGWICTTAGTPGTWKAMAVLAA